MGSGNWSDDAYQAAATFRAATGKADFSYHTDVRTRPTAEWKAHPELDPEGVTLRESRDSAEHPESTPIVVLFDVTGSMDLVPRVMQQQLSKLHGLLQRKGYVVDPQIMFGAIGDADSDRVPLQVGQFESDNRMDEQLRSIFLEGGGGGQKSESYELAAYFVARHTVTDAWEKRGRKGYLFLIGDEMNKPVLRARHVRGVLGDDLGEDMSVDDVYREVQERWETFFILPRQTSHFDDNQVRSHWRSLLGERLLLLEDPTAVCDLLGVTIGLLEEVITLSDGLIDLADVGSTAGKAVERALAPLASGGDRFPARIEGSDDLR